MLAAFAFALAVHACPPPDVPGARDWALAEDGTVDVLTDDATGGCWWRVDDQDDATLVTRWAAGEAPVALAALPGPRILFAFADGRLQVRDRAGARRTLHVALPAPVAHLRASSDRARVAIVDTVGRVHLLDVDTERIVAAGAGERVSDAGR